MCANKYAIAIAKPFSQEAIGACIPTFPSPDSMKVTCLTRSIPVYIGVNGYGAVFLSPSSANDVTCVYATTATFSGTSAFMPSVEIAGEWVGSAPTTLPFNRTQLQTQVQSRIVSFGLRMQYTGTQLNMGGTIAGYFNPTHELIGTDNLNMTSIVNQTYASFESVDRRMNFQLQTCSVNAHETSFLPQTLNYAGSDLGSGYGTMRNTAIGVILISGTPGNSFNLEVVTHVEYAGVLANSMASPTHTDARGFELVQQAAGQLARAAANNRTDNWALMQSLMASAARELAPAVVERFAGRPMANVVRRLI